jgi:hypothetical protein
VTATDAMTIDEVVRAGRVLFGPGFAADQAWWREALKATYRRRSFETHPDRARSLGRSETDLSREFQAVADAYRVLSQMRAGPLLPSRTGEDPPRPHRPRAPRDRAAHRAASSGGASGPRHTPRPRPPPEPEAAHRAHAPSPSQRGDGPRVRASVRPEDLPRRRLRFAEYLYYAGHVPWTVFVEAITWQRAQRPPLGRIAVDFGFLRQEHVAEILEHRRRDAAQGTPFGEYALGRGYVTSFQLLAMLGQQLRMQRPIGEYFVERGHIDATDVDEIRARLMRHNLRF